MTVKQFPMLNRPLKNTKAKAKPPCKCLTCAKTWREHYEDLTMLVCGEEACFLDCERCTDRPRCDGYTPIAEVI